jgi:hypothetical protein
VSSYIYTLVALTFISALLIYSLTSYTATLRNTSETEQLKNIMTRIATKANELLTLVTATNSSVRASILLPSFIGNQQYWIQLRNDSTRAWLEGSLGQTVGGGEVYQVSLPPKTATSGHFISGHVFAVLECHVNGSIPQLKLASSGG